MDIEIIEAKLDDKPVLKNLMQLYLYDFSEFEYIDVNKHGLFEYRYFDQYWVEKARYPFLIRYENKIAGFALVNSHSVTGKAPYNIAEFFVMRRYRRNGIGRYAATSLFDKFVGYWEVRQTENNSLAQTFWLNIIKEYTSNTFKNYRDGFGDWKGPIQLFKSNQVVKPS